MRYSWIVNATVKLDWAIIKENAFNAQQLMDSKLMDSVLFVPLGKESLTINANVLQGSSLKMEDVTIFVNLDSWLMHKAIAINAHWFKFLSMEDANAGTAIKESMEFVP